MLKPLQRFNEISIDVDDDPRAAYFRQVENGKCVRMALITKLMEWRGKDMENPQLRNVIYNPDGLACPNPTCISFVENVDQIVRLVNPATEKYRCVYCETTVRSN